MISRKIYLYIRPKMMCFSCNKVALKRNNAFLHSQFGFQSLLVRKATQSVGKNSKVAGLYLSGLWLMSRINDYLKELEQYITHSRLTNEMRLAVTKWGQKWVEVHSVSFWKCENFAQYFRTYLYGTKVNYRNLNWTKNKMKKLRILKNWQCFSSIEI